VEITEVKDLGPSTPLPKTGASPESRFGIRQHPFHWTAPESWIAQKTSQFRLINYQVAENTECYLTVLPGDGGGITPNINRWRGQMGLGPLSEGGISELELKPLLGSEAYAISCDGSFGGMGAQKQREGYRMLGLIQNFSGIMISVKMVGPLEEVKASTEDFFAFCESIRFRQQ